MTHNLLAGALALAVVLKVHRSVPRAINARSDGRRSARLGRLALGLTVVLVAVAALTGGYLSVALGELVWLDMPAVGRWTVMTLHAWVGVVLVPLVLIHLLPRRWRLLRPGAQAVERAGGQLLTRRAVLAGGMLGLAGAAAWAGAGAIELAARGHASVHRIALDARRRRPDPDDVLRRRDAVHRPGRVAAIGDWRGRPADRLVARRAGRTR